MKISYAWLKEYFEEPLPTAEELSLQLSSKLCEVESVTTAFNDKILDLKILPDRAHYALCHKGIAYEVSAITGKKSEHLYGAPEPSVNVTPKISVQSELCDLYVSSIVENASISNLDPKIKMMLEAIGARSVQNLVDLANYVMFDLGQPMHVFDKQKIVGDISVRMAKKSESIILLDGKEIVLDENILVIADQMGPLAIAGIKGGKRAEVTDETKDIVIESAHFGASYIRRASTVLNLKTDASKRFENRLPKSRATEAMDALRALIKKYNARATFGPIVIEGSNTIESKSFKCNYENIRALLGLDISDDDINVILEKLQITVKKSGSAYSVTVPDWRLDIENEADLVEEVGRMHGYEKIKDTLPSAASYVPPSNKTLFCTNKVRQFFIGKGFSEIYTHTFRNAGDVEIINPQAGDKKFLRSNLRDNLRDALALNLRHIDAVAIDMVRVFEMGKVFPKGQEVYSLAFGSANTKKKIGRVELEAILSELVSYLKPYRPIASAYISDDVVEIDSGKLIEEMSSMEVSNEPGPIVSSDIKYKSISSYPHIVRDVAVFVPSDIDAGDLEKIIREEAGELLQSVELFDIFSKNFDDGSIKKSYAFRLLFQSHERTLSDDEINKNMEKVSKTIEGRGWKVR